jgi:hypothetical protein
MDFFLLLFLYPEIACKRGAGLNLFRMHPYLSRPLASSHYGRLGASGPVNRRQTLYSLMRARETTSILSPYFATRTGLPPLYVSATAPKKG